MIDEIRNEEKKLGNEVKILIGATIRDWNLTIKKESDGMVDNYKATTNSYQTIKPFQSSFT
jgi:hypothetical protein